MGKKYLNISHPSTAKANINVRSLHPSFCGVLSRSCHCDDGLSSFSLVRGISFTEGSHLYHLINWSKLHRWTKSNSCKNFVHHCKIYIYIYIYKPWNLCRRWYWPNRSGTSQIFLMGAVQMPRLANLPGKSVTETGECMQPILFQIPMPYHLEQHQGTLATATRSMS